MLARRTTDEVLQCEFLQIRAKLIEVAAAMDRVERAEGSLEDPRWSAFQAAIEALQDAGADRAEQLQLLFSRPYSAPWRQQLGVPK